MSLMNDIPAGNSKNDDQLELAHYAGVLASFIKDCETPMTIGLQGDWGIGKSTLLNMLKSKIYSLKDGRKKYRIIEFNTWQYSLFGEDEYLGLSAINAMLKLIEEELG